MRCHVVSCGVMWCCPWCRACLRNRGGVMWCHVVSCGVMWCHVVLPLVPSVPEEPGWWERRRRRWRATHWWWWRHVAVSSSVRGPTKRCHVVASSSVRAWSDQAVSCGGVIERACVVRPSASAISHTHTLSLSPHITTTTTDDEEQARYKCSAPPRNRGVLSEGVILLADDDVVAGGGREGRARVRACVCARARAYPTRASAAGRRGSVGPCRAAPRRCCRMIVTLSC